MTTSIRTIPFLFAATLGAACSSAAPVDPTGTSSDALMYGASTNYPVVIVSTDSGLECTGTMVTATWLLTTIGCKPSSGSPLDFLVTDTLHGRSAYVAAWAAQGGALLLQLETALPFTRFPAIATSPLPNAPLTCTGFAPDSYAAEQATYSVTWDANGTPSATTTAMITDGDCGGGCFIDDSLVGFALGCVEGQSCVLASIADYADFIRSNVGAPPFCGTWTCGLQPAGSVAVSCGTCAEPEYCSAGACVDPSTLTPPPPFPRTCPSNMIDCGDGTCVPRGRKCQ